jgi:hypothetical protein
VLTVMGPAAPQLNVTAAAAWSFPVVSAVWYGPQDPEVELVVVWKEDMVNWLVVGIRCEESGFVESNAEMRTTTLFNRARMLRQLRRVRLREWMSTGVGTIMFHSRYMRQGPS